MDRLEVDITKLTSAATSFERMADDLATVLGGLVNADIAMDFGPHYRDLEHRIDCGVVDIVATLNTWKMVCAQCGELLRRSGNRYLEVDKLNEVRLAEGDRHGGA